MPCFFQFNNKLYSRAGGDGCPLDYTSLLLKFRKSKMVVPGLLMNYFYYKCMEQFFMLKWERLDTLISLSAGAIEWQHSYFATILLFYAPPKLTSMLIAGPPHQLSRLKLHSPYHRLAVKSPHCIVFEHTCKAGDKNADSAGLRLVNADAEEMRSVQRYTG